MPTDDRRWTDADREPIRPYLIGTGDHCGKASCEYCQDELDAQCDVLLDALTAAGWRPPPPEPDGIHWRVGGSVGCTIYGPDGALAGMMLTPEAAAAVVAKLNAHADEGGTDAAH